jgi:hypothetical protein
MLSAAAFLTPPGARTHRLSFPKFPRINTRVAAFKRRKQSTYRKAKPLISNADENRGGGGRSWIAADHGSTQRSLNLFLSARCRLFVAQSGDSSFQQKSISHFFFILLLFPVLPLLCFQRVTYSFFRSLRATPCKSISAALFAKTPGCSSCTRLSLLADRYSLFRRAPLTHSLSMSSLRHRPSTSVPVPLETFLCLQSYCSLVPTRLHFLFNQGGLL